MPAVFPVVDYPGADQHLVPLLDQDHEVAERPRCRERLLKLTGMRSVDELIKVSSFMLASFFANTFFVIGRNVGTVLFLSYTGPDYLATAIFTSGALTVVVGQAFSSASKGRFTTTVNEGLMVITMVTMTLLYVATIYLKPGGANTEFATAAVWALSFTIYFAEDIFSNFIAMQNATVAQSAFSVTDAKRMFGLVQLGNSLAAMTVGISIGAIAAALGTEQMLIVQAIVCVLSVLLNRFISRHYVEPAGGGRKKNKKKPKQNESSGPARQEPWWHNWLVLAMALWGFTVIFTKTMYEYQYNVIVVQLVTKEEMVALTGYLYAGAGLLSTLINLYGCKKCMDLFGMQGAILATPAALLTVSFGILASPGVASTFVGRLVDLSLRWSLNNTVRTVLWIAVPAAQAVTAKPWVEGTIKKLGQSFNAIVISVTLAITGGSLAALSALSMIFSGLLLFCCFRVYSLYLDSMWARIKRRELKHQKVGQLQCDAHISKRVLDTLLHGGPAAQLDILLQMGQGISDEDWKLFFASFPELSSAVQVNVIELSRKQQFRVPSDFLLKLISNPTTESSVLQAAMLAASDRKMHNSLKFLSIHLGSKEPSVRAAAATSILKMGWGIGLGEISTAALQVLEHMLDFYLIVPGSNNKFESSPTVTRLQLSTAFGRTALTGLESPGTNGWHRATSDETDVDIKDDLTSRVNALTHSWEKSIAKGDTMHAIVLAIQLTHVKTAMQSAEDPKSPVGPRPRKVSGSFVPDDLQLPAAPLDGRVRHYSATEDGDEAPRWVELAVALQMVQQLPDARSLISFDTWLEVLKHDSDQVRAAALTFVREEDVNHLQFNEEVRQIVFCLQSSETYKPAEAAMKKLLRKIDRPICIQIAILDHLQEIRDQHKEWINQRVDNLGQPDGNLASSSQSVYMLNLLKFLRRQWKFVSDQDLQILKKSDLCDSLLDLTNDVADSDTLQELHQTLLDLKDTGYHVTRQLVEKRMKEVAVQICKGLAVQQWTKYLGKNVQLNDITPLHQYLELPRDTKSCAQVSRQSVHSGNVLEHVLKVMECYTDEQIYLQKLELFQLSVLVAPPMPASYRSTRVLAAWRVLRSKESAEEAAVLELLDSMLPPTLKAFVLPLLDSSPLDNKISVGMPLSSELTVISESGATQPPWMEQWFRYSLSASRLGRELAIISRLLKRLTGTVTPIPSTVTSNVLMPKLVLLHPQKLFADLLSIHVAEIATVATIREYVSGDMICDEGEAYVIARGRFTNLSTGETSSCGDMLQTFHVISKDLQRTEIICDSSDGGTALCIQRQHLFELMVRLPPKFALGLLKAVVRMLPEPAQVGGQRLGGNTFRDSGNEIRLSEACDNIHAQRLLSTSRLTRTGGRTHPSRTGSCPALDTRGLNAPVLDQDVRESPEVGEDILLLARQYGEDNEAEDEEKGDSQDGEVPGPLSESSGTTKALDCEEGFVKIADDAERNEARQTFSMVEKLLVLQAVKIFRYVPVEYLPSIAKCCESTFKEKGAEICTQGAPTDATLYIVADGLVDLYCRDPFIPEQTKGELQRQLSVSDTMGNTGLLLDATWNYSATAAEDVWLLCISRIALTDVLRGRRELASAVIHGLYKTFTRRIKMAVEGMPCRGRALTGL